MQFSLVPVLVLSLVLSGCGKDWCNNAPVCLDPVVYGRNHEIQPDPAQMTQPVVIVAGESQTITVTFNRNGLPDSLPIFFPSALGYYPGENVGGDPQQSQQTRGTLLYERGGLKLTAAANPFTGSSTQLTVSVAAGTPAGFYGFQIFVQKQNTRYGSSRALFFTVKVP